MPFLIRTICGEMAARHSVGIGVRDTIGDGRGIVSARAADQPDLPNP